MKISNFRIFMKIVEALFSKAVTLEINPKVFKPWSNKQLAFLKSLPEIFKFKPLFPPLGTLEVYLGPWWVPPPPPCVHI